MVRAGRDTETLNPSLGTAKPIALRMRRFLPLACSFSVCFALALGGRCLSPEGRADILGSNPEPKDACDV